MTKELIDDKTETDDGYIHPENLVSDKKLNKLEGSYWTGDYPRCVHDMIATIRYLRNEIRHLENTIEDMAQQ